MEFIENKWINKGVIEKRAYQENIAKTALRANTLCVIPTGLGKTSIAALVAAERLERYSKSKILLMAPTRPLVDQHKNTFERLFRTGLEMKTVTGSDKPEERSELYRRADIIFSTPQTIRNDLKKNILNLENFSLLIFDEAHRSVGNYAYPYVAKIYNYHCKNPLILALTASPGGHMIKINEVKSKLFIDNVEVRTRNDSDVKNYVQEVEKEWVAVEFTIPLKSIKRYLESAKEERIKKLMSWNVLHSTMVTKTQMLKLQQELARKKKGYSYAAMSVLAEVIKIDHALLLLETQCLYSLKKYSDSIATQASSGETKAAVRIMKDENFMNAIRLTSELINEGKEHPKMEKMKEIVQKELEENKYARIMIFAQYRDTITKICEVLKEIRTASPVEFIGQAKKKGKGLSQKEQMQILNEFKMGFYNILVASQVGEEGLDVVETNMVIFYEPVPSAIRRVQRAGRTGRTQEGKVVTLITKNTRDEAYHWSGHQKEKKMTGILYNMKKQSDLKSFDRD